MIRTRAKVNERVRILVPNMHTLTVLPPGTRLEVVGHLAGDPMMCLADVIYVPASPEEYHVVVPKGAKVHVVEE